MTEEKLNKAWQLHDSIKTKKWYLKALLKLIEAPKTMTQTFDVNEGMGYSVRVTIPADMVKDELMRQAKELTKEIEQLESEFNVL